MQPERSLAPSHDNAIANHPALAALGGQRAKALWQRLLKLAGNRTGRIEITEAGMVALIGGGPRSSVRASGGSKGPLDRLEDVGAVERLGPGRWLIRVPADAVELRRADLSENSQQNFPAMEADEPPPAEPPVLPHPGLTRDSRVSHVVDGGKGGRCAPDRSIQEEQETNSSCSSSARDSRVSHVATWQSVFVQLVNLGVYGSNARKSIERIRGLGGRPSDVTQLCEYFSVNPDHLDLGAGALACAVENWVPGIEYCAVGLWPQVPLPLPVGDQPKTPRQLNDEKEHARTLLVRSLGKRGCDREQINVVLRKLGHLPVETASGIEKRPFGRSNPTP